MGTRIWNCSYIPEKAAMITQSQFLKEQQPLGDQRKMGGFIYAAIRSPKQLLVHMQGTPPLFYNAKDEGEVLERGSMWSD